EDLVLLASRAVARPSARDDLRPRPLDGRQISQKQLGLDNPDVAHRIDGALHMRDFPMVIEAADDVEEGVDLSDPGEELVAQALPLVGVPDQAGAIDDLQGGRYDALGMGD